MLLTIFELHFHGKVSDLKSLVMNDLLSDVVFVVDSVPFPAHRVTG